MESKAKLLGHPIHPILVVFPLGLLATAVIFDLVHLMTGHGYWSEIAYWMILAGIVGGLLAAAFGLIDWLIIPSNTRAKTIGLWHGFGNVVVIALFVVSWILRREAPANPGWIAIGLGLAGALIAAVTGWLGGELVDRMGVGVDTGAHLNAPNSLSGKPARENSN